MNTLTNRILVSHGVSRPIMRPNGERFSSKLRSNGKWLQVFRAAKLKIVKEEIQVGLPEELFMVKTCVTSPLDRQS